MTPFDRLREYLGVTCSPESAKSQMDALVAADEVVTAVFADLILSVQLPCRLLLDSKGLVLELPDYCYCLVESGRISVGHRDHLFEFELVHPRSLEFAVLAICCIGDDRHFEQYDLCGVLRHFLHREMAAT